MGEKPKGMAAARGPSARAPLKPAPTRKPQAAVAPSAAPKARAPTSNAAQNNANAQVVADLEEQVIENRAFFNGLYVCLFVCMYDSWNNIALYVY